LWGNPNVGLVGRKAAKDGLVLMSKEFNKRLERLTAAQQKDLKNLLEKIL
jgi:MarR family transcriptional regulator, temperature-dependent positive regulator of motility